jgi:hypothetical protein
VHTQFEEVRGYHGHSDLRREWAVGCDDGVPVLEQRLFVLGAVLEQLPVLRDDLQRGYLRVARVRPEPELLVLLQR